MERDDRAGCFALVLFIAFVVVVTGLGLIAQTRNRHYMEQQIITRCQDIWPDGNVEIEPINIWFDNTYHFTVTVTVDDDIVFFVQDEKTPQIFEQLNKMDGN